jgi:hypothetical protein
LLRKREERFRLSLSALRGLVYDRDLVAEKSVRHGLKQMLGYDELPDAPGSSAWMEIVHPDDRERYSNIRGQPAVSKVSTAYRIRHMDSG